MLIYLWRSKRMVCKGFTGLEVCFSWNTYTIICISTQLLGPDPLILYGVIGLHIEDIVIYFSPESFKCAWCYLTHASKRKVVVLLSKYALLQEIFYLAKQVWVSPVGCDEVSVIHKTFLFRSWRILRFQLDEINFLGILLFYFLVASDRNCFFELSFTIICCVHIILQFLLNCILREKK